MFFKFFKSVDQRLAEIGFEKIYESKLILQYKRENEEFNYFQGVDLVKKTGRYPIIQSYQDDNNAMVGLNVVEIKLFLKKIKNLGWKF